jgi:hypothetical protein
MFNLPKNIKDCSDEHITVYFIINLFQQGIMKTLDMSKAPRKNEDKSKQDEYLKYEQSQQIGISNIINDKLKRQLRDFPNYEILPWLHPGRTQCRAPYHGKYGKYMKEYLKNNEYEASLQCGISSSVQYILYMYLVSISFSGTLDPKKDVNFTLISAIMTLVGDGGHNIREIITGFTLSIIVLYNFMNDLKKELRDITGKKNGEFQDFNFKEIPSTILCDHMNNFIKLILKIKSINYDQELTIERIVNKINIKQEDIYKISEIKGKNVFVFNQLLISFGNWENYINQFYSLTKYINPLGVYTEDINKYNIDILNSEASKKKIFDETKKAMYKTIFIQNTKQNIDMFNMAQLFFSLDADRYELDPNISFKYAPNNIVNKILIELQGDFKDILKDVNLLIQSQLDECKKDISAIHIPLAFNPSDI